MGIFCALTFWQVLHARQKHPTRQSVMALPARRRYISSTTDGLSAARQSIHRLKTALPDDLLIPLCCSLDPQFRKATTLRACAAIYAPSMPYALRTPPRARQSEMPKRHEFRQQAPKQLPAHGKLQEPPPQDCANEMVLATANSDGKFKVSSSAEHRTYLPEGATAAMSPKAQQGKQPV